MLVHPKGFEPLSLVPETKILSIELRVRVANIVFTLRFLILKRNNQFVRRLISPSKAGALHVKSKMHNIAIFNDIAFTFNA